MKSTKQLKKELDEKFGISWHKYFYSLLELNFDFDTTICECYNKYFN